MTGAEAWEKLIGRGYVEPNMGGGFSCGLFDADGNEASKSNGPSPEAAIAAAFGETLEPDAPTLYPDPATTTSWASFWFGVTLNKEKCIIRIRPPEELGDDEAEQVARNILAAVSELRSLRDATCQGCEAR